MTLFQARSIGQSVWSQKAVSWFISAQLNLADLLMCFRWDQRLRKYVETPWFEELC